MQAEIVYPEMTIEEIETQFDEVIAQFYGEKFASDKTDFFTRINEE